MSDQVAIERAIAFVKERDFHGDESQPDTPIIFLRVLLSERDALAERVRVLEGAADRWSNDPPSPTKPGTYISVRVVETYRWLAYKPDGARQMRAKGRWQKFEGFGFSNAAIPHGAEWRELPDTSQQAALSPSPLVEPE